MRKQDKPNKLPPNIRERDGKYTYRYRVPTTKNVDGKEVKSSKGKESPRFDSIQEAVDFGILIQAQKLQKKLKHTNALTVSAWSKTWLKEYILEREPAGNTIKNRKYGLTVLLEQFGGFNLPEVTPSQYQEFLYKLKNDGKKRSTVTAIHTAASLMFEHAKRKGLIETDPVQDAVIPREKKMTRIIGEKNKSSPNFLRRTS